MIDLKDFFPEEEQPLERLLPDGGFCGIFRTIGCVGDSLSSGEFQTRKKDGSWRYNDMYEYSWGQYIARATGSTVYNFSKGGMTAKKYIDSFAEERGFWDPKLACQAYIIALGANDKNHIQPGSLADLEQSEPQETFVWYYNEIIRRLKEIQPNAKFFLMTQPGRDEQTNERNRPFSEAVRQLAGYHTNCYLMDMARYHPVVDDFCREKFWLNGHINPAGYILEAKLIMSYMDYIIRHNIRDFDYVGFIGKEHLLQD